MGRRFVCRAPAKVNLALRVLGRFSDGYHRLDTVFQTIDLWDRLEIEPADGLYLECEGTASPPGEENLVLRAARRLRERLGERRWGARLRLVKRIPVGAGLGGGSADAAAALAGCAALWGLDPEPAQLARLAAELGADVPFFLVGGTARGTGRGDVIRPLPDVGPLPLLLGCPGFGIATAEVYRRAATRLTPSDKGVSLSLLFSRKWRSENDFGFAVNDLEQVVFADWPELGRFRDALLEVGAGAALLSGSGSTVFGIFGDEDGLASARAELGERFAGWSLVVSRAVPGGVRVEPVTTGPGGPPTEV